MKKVMIINGPNLNMLGVRETKIYGSKSLDEIKSYTESLVDQFNFPLRLDWFQSNIEGEIIDYIHQAIREDYAGIIINPAAYSHTSLAILDALKCTDIFKAEVHLTHVFSREERRKELLTAQGVNMIMCGQGKNSYFLALQAFMLHEEI